MTTRDATSPPSAARPPAASLPVGGQPEPSPIPAFVSPAGSRTDRAWAGWLATAAALPMSAFMAWTCFEAAGPSFGMLLGPILLSTALAPPLVMAERSIGRGLLVVGGVTAGVSAVWFAAAGAAGMSVGDVLSVTLVLATYLFALGSGAMFLRAARVTPALASFLAVLAGLLWLTWPFWLSPWLGGHERPVRYLAAAHPLLAANAAVPHMGFWLEKSLAYHHTALNRDVALVMPAGVKLAAGVHAAAAGGFALATRMLDRTRTEI